MSTSFVDTACCMANHVFSVRSSDSHEFGSVMIANKFRRRLRSFKKFVIVEEELAAAAVVIVVVLSVSSFSFGDA
jgi:hypothetical protein